MGTIKDWLKGILSDEQDRENNDEGHVIFQTYPTDPEGRRGDFYSVTLTSCWHPLRPVFAIGAELIGRKQYVVYISFGIYTLALDRTFYRGH